MKVSYEILKKFVTPPKGVSADSLANTLTMHTVEVEEILDFKKRLQGALVGLVEEVKNHPGADKLKLATVDIGKKSLEVVCGGVNLKEGMKVAFASIGTQVRWHGEADWAPLEKATIRGVVSEGMACAAEELGLYDPQAIEHGIMDLSDLDAKPGTPLAEALGLDDVIIEIDNKSITHRPDLWGHLGLARELAAVWHQPFNLPVIKSLQSRGHTKLQIKIKNSEYCRRYLGLIVSGVKVTSSPDWLQKKLLMLGMRPINNIVDVTNYVMLELGQPLHAFDLAKLEGAEITVRLANKGESIVTLDGETRKLDIDTLVIADNKQAQAVAGVMGGKSSEVGEQTESIIIESANFDPVSIRQTSLRLGLRTEASARFEKSLDPELSELAIRRAVELLKEVIPECSVVSELVDVYPNKPEVININLNIAWLKKRLGCELGIDEVQHILESLGFKVTGAGQELKVTVPSWRATRDITIPEDLIEEVARIYGYAKIPLSLPAFSIAPPIKEPEQDFRWQIRDLLVSTGWTETLSYSFVGSKAGGKLELVNPVDKTKQFLRPNLLTSFAEQFAAAKRASSASIKMFELGRVFQEKDSPYPASAKGNNKLPNQPWHLILAAYDKNHNSFRVLKGVIELIESKTGVELKPEYQELSGGVTAEIEIEGLFNQGHIEFKSLPKYPKVERDVSIIMPRGVKWSEIESVVKKGSALIDKINVFDVYEAKNSIAFTIVFRDQNRTLKSDEVDEVMNKMTKILQDKFNVTFR